MAKPPIEFFRVEANEILDRLVSGVASLRSGEARTGTVQELLRAAHTLKGAAHVVREAAMAEDAHAFETELAPYAQSDLVPDQALAALLAVTDRIASRLAKIGNQPEAATRQAPTTEGFSSAASDEAEAAATMRVEADDVDELTRSLAEIGARAADLHSALATVENVLSLANAMNLQVSRGRTSGRSDQFAEMAVMAKELQAHVAQLETSSTDSLRRLDRELAHARDISARLRMAPAGELFAILERAVRNTADALGKRCRFEFNGREQRLDSSLLSAVRDALLHLVRNAVAHGIEQPDERRARGKPEQGTVLLDVSLNGTHVVFRCSDDGRGVDGHALRAAAVARGIISVENSASISDADLLQLVFRPGLTTETAAGQHAGRGIGLDVVHSTAARLNGQARISTRPAQGTTVELSVPAAMFGISALVVAAGGFQVSLPVDTVAETVHITDAATQTVSGRSMAVVNDVAYRVLALSDLLRGHSVPAEKGDSRALLLLRMAEEKTALAVDRVLGAHEYALSTFRPFVPVSECVIGAAIDGLGKLQVLIDPILMVKTVADIGPAAEGEIKERVLPLLVIDDSLTTRMLEQSILESAGYEVHTAMSGDEALAKARHVAYGLFLVDVEMPGMDGFSFIQATKADTELRDIPSILVTSRSSVEDRERGLEVGASEYIVKSEFDQGFLLSRIAELARRA